MSQEVSQKDNKFGQLIEHNMRTCFSKNHLQNEVEKLFSDAFSKKAKLSISLH